MRVMPLPILGAKCKWKPVKRDKSTSRDFIACGRRLRGQTRLAPLTKRSTCGKSRIAGNKDYFTSSAWQNTEEKVKLYQGIKKPHYSNINQAERQSSNQRPSPSIHRHSLSTLPHLVVQGEIQNHVSIWKFPISISQSTVGGRRGSNACTFISLLLAKYYYCNPSCNNHELT